MSSYLTFYIKPKGKNKKPLALLSYSRSSDMYQIINNTLNPPFIGIEEPLNYEEITRSQINEVIQSVKNNLAKFTHDVDVRIKAYLDAIKHMGNDSVMDEYLNYCADTNTYIEEQKDLINELTMIGNIAEEMQYSGSDFDKMFINVD